MTALDLQREPFLREPDSLFYYSFDSIEQRLKVLEGLIKGADLFILVIGEPGSGKTTMLNRYLASTESDWTSARIQVDPEKTAAESSAKQAQKGYPVYTLRGSADPIVIVDDAHRLPQKGLEFLIQEALLPGSRNKIKRLVLFGESELHTRVLKLAETLSDPPAVNKIYLPGLTQGQTADYLRHRLETAGYSGELPFDADAIKSVHQNSGGYPGPMNEFAHQWLVDTYSRKQEGQNMLKKLSSGSRRMVTWISTGAIIILLSLAAFWFFSDRTSSAPKTAHQKQTKTVVRKKIAQFSEMTEPLAALKAKIVTRPITLPKAVQTDQPQKVETAQPGIVKKAETGEPPKPQTAPPQETELPSSAPAAVIAKNKPTAAPSELLKKAQPQEAPAPQQKQQPVAKPPEPKPAPVTAGPKGRKIRREEWLLSQNAEFYTIQIVGVSSEKSLLNFIKRNELLKLNEIAYYKSTFQGKPWYQVLYGIYASGQDARIAADKLPQNIRRAGPWIRKISGVQKAIADAEFAF